MNYDTRALLAGEKYIALEYTISHQMLIDTSNIEYYAKREMKYKFAKHIVDHIEPQIKETDEPRGRVYRAYLYTYSREDLINLLDKAYMLGLNTRNRLDRY